MPLEPVPDISKVKSCFLNQLYKVHEGPKRKKKKSKLKVTKRVHM